MRIHARQIVLLVLTISVTGCITTTTGEFKAWKDAERVDVHTELGLGYIAQGQEEIARQELETALQIDPKNSRANLAMATLMERLEKPQDAGRFYARAVQYGPNNVSARNEYGRFLCSQGRYNDGLVQFTQALNNPVNRRSQLSSLGAGLCLVSDDRDDEARQYFEAALTLDPKLKPALIEMARINHDDGNYLSARGYIERYFDSGTATPDSLILAYRNEIKLGAEDLADYYAGQLRALFPRSPEMNELRELQSSRS